MEYGQTPAQSKCDVLQESEVPEVNSSQNYEKPIWYTFQPDQTPFRAGFMDMYRAAGSQSKNSTETKESRLQTQGAFHTSTQNHRISLQTDNFKQQAPKAFTQTFNNADTLKSIMVSSQNFAEEQRQAFITDLMAKNNNLSTKLQRVESQYQTLVLKYKQALGEIEHLNKEVHSLKTTAASSRQQIPVLSSNPILGKSIQKRPPSQFIRPPSQYFLQQPKFISHIQRPSAQSYRLMSPLTIVNPSIPHRPLSPNIAHRPLSPSNMPLLVSKLQNLQVQRQQQRQQIASLRSQLSQPGDTLPMALSNDEHEKIEYIQKQMSIVANSSRRIAQELNSPARSPPQTVQGVERMRRLERTKALCESENQELKMKLLLKDRKIQELEERITSSRQKPIATSRQYYM